MKNHFSWQSAFIKSDLQPLTKLVLFVIGSRMNMHGDGAFPSYQTIGKDASISRRTAIRHVEEAEIQGWIKKEVRHNGELNTSNIYSVAFPKEVVTPQTLPSDSPDTRGSVPGDTLTLPLLSPQLTPSISPKENQENGLDKSFEQFWTAYPRKTDKKKSRAIWMRIKPNEGLFAKIMSSIAKQRQTDSWTKDDGKFIPHAATWLNGERWDDVIQTGSSRDDEFGMML